MKKLFSNIWFRCISVHLIIALISGGVLALLNDLLFVSPLERSMRAIKKIYGEEKEISTIIDTDSDDETINSPIEFEEYGTINKIFKVQNGNTSDLLFRTTGIGGYNNGTVTLWVQVVYQNNQEKIQKVILEGFEKQTLMSKLDGSFYNNYLIDISDDYFVENKDEQGLLNPVSGATYSATASNNAVNCVIAYLRGTR